jgi:transglutaminase-like putative cysteine protease
MTAPGSQNDGLNLEQILERDQPFLEHANLPWAQVKRARYFAHQRFEYVYPSRVRDLSQRLMVRPPSGYGDQRLLDFKLNVQPGPARKHELRDTFGNPVIELEVASIRHGTTFEVMLCTERETSEQHPRVPASKIERWLSPTPLTTADDRILEIARDLQRQSNAPLELAQRINDWVSNTMTYQSDVTDVHTTASEALEIGRGLCQDYAHVTLAICRAAGLPARYVSGHMLGEGGSHAWVEVIVPEGNHLEAIGFDPTNHRRPNLGYTVVAVGRDYADVPPTSGRFIGRHAGQLHFQKRAGLIELEFHDGRVEQA